MKLIITILIYVFLAIAILGVLSSVTDGFSAFGLEKMAENADSILNSVKGWFG